MSLFSKRLEIEIVGDQLRLDRPAGVETHELDDLLLRESFLFTTKDEESRRLGRLKLEDVSRLTSSLDESAERQLQELGRIDVKSTRRTLGRLDRALMALLPFGLLWTAFNRGFFRSLEILLAGPGQPESEARLFWLLALIGSSVWFGFFGLVAWGTKNHLTSDRLTERLPQRYRLSPTGALARREGFWIPCKPELDGLRIDDELVQPWGQLTSPVLVADLSSQMLRHRGIVRETMNWRNIALRCALLWPTVLCALGGLIGRWAGLELEASDLLLPWAAGLVIAALLLTIHWVEAWQKRAHARRAGIVIDV